MSAQLLALAAIIALFSLIIIIKYLSQSKGISQQNQELLKLIQQQNEKIQSLQKKHLPEKTPTLPTESETSSEFLTFLREDPARLTMSKRDQSAAFRQWRRQQGLTWNG